MSVKVIKDGTNLIAQIDGDLDMVTGLKLKELFDKMWDEHEMLSCLVLDLTNVDFNDSTGLGAILGRYKKVNARGGNMVIVGAKGSVKEDLEMSGILKLCSYKSCLDEVAITKPY